MDNDDLRLVLVELTGEVKGLKETMSLKLDNMLLRIDSGDSRNAQISEALKGSLDVVAHRVEEVRARQDAQEQQTETRFKPLEDFTSRVKGMGVLVGLVAGSGLGLALVDLLTRHK